MATSKDYIEFVCEQVSGTGSIRYTRMFGEYMVYIDEKPILLVCDNLVFVKTLGCIANLMKDARMLPPYSGAKPHYMLDIENKELTDMVIKELLKVAYIPKAKRNRIMTVDTTPAGYDHLDREISTGLPPVLETPTPDVALLP
ncbi:MAG: transcriptional regulator [Bacteroidales bacterium]